MAIAPRDKDRTGGGQPKGRPGSGNPPVVVDRECVGGVGLQLHCVGGCLLCKIKQLERAIEAAAVIGGKLGDDIGRLVGANNTPGNSNRLFH
jgi:hypothetical protein